MSNHRFVLNYNIYNEQTAKQISALSSNSSNKQQVYGLTLIISVPCVCELRVADLCSAYKTIANCQRA